MQHTPPYTLITRLATTTTTSDQPDEEWIHPRRSDEDLSSPLLRLRLLSAGAVCADWFFLYVAVQCSFFDNKCQDAPGSPASPSPYTLYGSRSAGLDRDDQGLVQVAMLDPRCPGRMGLRHLESWRTNSPTSGTAWCIAVHALHCLQQSSMSN